MLRRIIYFVLLLSLSPFSWATDEVLVTGSRSSGEIWKPWGSNYYTELTQLNQNGGSGYVAYHDAKHRACALASSQINVDYRRCWSDAEAAEIKQWYRDRGKFFASHDVEYKNYDELTLRKLADTGDIRALHALADLYIDDEHFGLEGYGLEATNDLFWKAAAYGSTEALNQLALNVQVLKYSKTGPELENRQHALEVLSLYNVAALRGDELPNIANASDFKFLNHINLSDDEKKFIEQRSQEIYNHLLQKRIELGLGNFDNSQPESVKKFFARMRAVEESD